MIHLAPLPGAPAAELPLTRILEQACRDARILAEAGFDALLMENFGDAPFRPGPVDAHTVACMTLAARAVRQAVALPLGINVLRNDPQAALAIATICQCRFIRVNVHSGVYATDQGIIEGRADQTLRYRRLLGSLVGIFADVHVKHARPLSSVDIRQAASDTAYRGRADALIGSGAGTGRAIDLADLQAVRTAVPDRPILIGSGARAETIAELLPFADGVIVGTAIKQDGVTTAPVDPQRAARFVQAAKS